MPYQPLMPNRGKKSVVKSAKDVKQRSHLLAGKNECVNSSLAASADAPTEPGEKKQGAKSRTVSATSSGSWSASAFSTSSSPVSSTSKAASRRAIKSALALRQLILPDLSPNLGTSGTKDRTKCHASSFGRAKTFPSRLSGRSSSATKSSITIPLSEKDVTRLRSQLLRAEEAALVIAEVKAIDIKTNAESEKEGFGIHGGIDCSRVTDPSRAVCLNCPEAEAESLIVSAQRTQKLRREKDRHLLDHRYSTIKEAPLPPPRLPLLLSLLQTLDPTCEEPLINVGSRTTTIDKETIGNYVPFGLFMPASAMSLHRPLAGALPSPDTLRRGFDALINAEAKIYLLEGPNHEGIRPPTDRMSVYTYWWGFELALGSLNTNNGKPSPTMAYLSHAKTISLSLLNLLSVIVYAVPGGTRELAPFIGVLSRYIEAEWLRLKSQDSGRGIVCAATWFIPAAIVARPWDYDSAHVPSQSETRKSESDATNFGSVSGEEAEPNKN